MHAFKNDTQVYYLSSPNLVLALKNADGKVRGAASVIWENEWSQNAETLFGKFFSTRKYFSVGECGWGGGGGEGVDGQSLSHNAIGDPCKNLCKK